MTNANANDPLYLIEENETKGANTFDVPYTRVPHNSLDDEPSSTSTTKKETEASIITRLNELPFFFGIFLFC